MDIPTTIVVGVAIGVIVLIIEYNYFQKKQRPLFFTRFWRFAIALFGRLGTGVRAIYKWLRVYRRLVVGFVILLTVAYSSFVVTQSLWSIVIILGLTISILLIAGHHSPISQIVFETIPLPVGKVANANLRGKYLNLPMGEVKFGGVKFLLKPDASVFDTTQARYIESDGRIVTELKLPKPATQVQSVHLLINAGGAYKSDQDSGALLEWLQIGRIQLAFTDKTIQDTELVLGGNVREWSIGNAPGKLVDRVDDPASQVAWRGKNSSGKYAVIDRLKIPLQEINRSKQIESIVFIRDIHWDAKPAEGGKVHYFVSAVTLERRA